MKRSKRKIESKLRGGFPSNGGVSNPLCVQIKKELMMEEVASTHRKGVASDGASNSREMITAASATTERQNGTFISRSARQAKKLKLNDTQVALCSVVEISSRLTNEEDTEFSNNDIYNTFLFHDDHSHRNQTDNILSVNLTPKDWVSLFYTETFYELMECKGDWDSFSGSTKEAKIYLALLLQMGSVKLPEIVQYWRKERTHFDSNFWRDNMKIEDFVNDLRSDDDYCKAFVEAINGSLEEFCHSKIGYSGLTWRGKVGIRRYFDPTRKNVEGSMYVLAETDGMVLKIILKKESERPKSVDILMELLKKACGFGKLFNRTDVYVGMELSVVSKDDAKERINKDRMNSNWKFIDVVVKLVALGDDSTSGQQMELLLVNLVKTRDSVEVQDGSNNVFLTNVDFGNRCHNWSRLSWRSRAIIDVINLSVNTAYVLSVRHNQNDDKTLGDFRHDLVESILTEAFTSMPDVNEDASECATLFVNSNDATSQDGLMEPIALSPHDVMAIESVESNFHSKIDQDYLVHALVLISEEKPRPRRRCRRCYKNGVRKETSYMCASCPGQYVLCQTCHPEHLDEIIREFLKKPLEDYVKKLPVPVIVARSPNRTGLIRARLLGWKRASGQVLTFLDAHCECSQGWLEPLLTRIAQNKTRVVCPVIDIIHDETFAYIKSFEMHWGSFNWELHFRWFPIGEKELRRRKGDVTLPFNSPVMAGGLFSIDRKYFEEMGTYDEGMNIWGGENLEMSFRIWQCGGSVEIVPCSHVGHVFRRSSPYKFPGQGGIGSILYTNLARVAEVWMDEYKDFFYTMNYEAAKVRPNLNVTSRTQLRKRLKCQNFKWYLDNVWPEHFLPSESRFFGKIRNEKNGKCVNRPLSKTGVKQTVGRVALKECVIEVYPQQCFVYTREGKIMSDESVCLDSPEGKEDTNVVMLACVEITRQNWKYDPLKMTIRHQPSNLCLDLPSSHSPEGLTLQKCHSDASQNWVLEPVEWLPIEWKKIKNKPSKFFPVNMNSK